MEKETVVLQLPAPFISACKKYQVSPQKVLQYFINNLTYINTMVEENPLLASKATSVLLAYHGFPNNPKKGDAFEELYNTYFLSLSLLTFAEKWNDGPYSRLMREWYEALSGLINKQPE